MKKQILFLSSLLLASILYAQININPDPNDDPWIIGGCSGFSNDGNTPIITTPIEYLDIDLPTEYYNYTWEYFPPILDQLGSTACVSYAEIGYTFTYEINRKRSVPAGDWNTNLENCYHPHYTFNFLNNGDPYNTGTQLGNALNVIKDNGCPELTDYDDPALDNIYFKYLYWMNGFDNYKNGMENRIDSKSNILFTDQYESLEDIKHWIFHHFENINPGGLANISVNASSWETTIGELPSGLPHANVIITHLGDPDGPGHALTIVGYNDEIGYDLNGDGEITIDIDIFGDDNEVNLKDREIGAFLIVNSWGADWGYNGRIWLPYCLIVDHLSTVGNNPPQNKFQVCHVSDSYVPQLTIKASIECDLHRNHIKVFTGYTNKANESVAIEYAEYNSFKFQGGYHDMRAAYPGFIDLSLDYGYHFINDDFGKIFLKINKLGNNPIGFLNHFSIIDYRWNEIFELDCQDLINGPLQLTGQGNTIAFVNYDLIPHETPITQNLLLDSDMVSRFQPSVTSGAQLTVADNVNIDMYNSTITIDASSSLVLGNGVEFAAKTGNCKLIINGNATFGDNLSFIAENNAALQIEINNTATNAQFDGAIFTQCQISSQAESLHFINSTFTQCGTIASYRGNISCNNSEFIESSLDFVNSGKNNDEAIITNCSFYSDANTVDAININAYTNYKIENCNIENFQGLNTGYLKGILIENSGGGADYNNISFNEIKDCIETAIVIYNSVADISLNNIHNNGNGIKLFDYSNVTVTGNSSAQNNSGTQQISNNTFTEIFATYGSFPSIMEYNVIIDDDNLGGIFDPLVYYANTNSKDNLKTISNNCWENVVGSFNPSLDFYPPSAFIYQPVWCPGAGGSPKTGAALLYETAKTQLETDEFALAQQTFESIIDNYPASDYADAAVKELFSLTKQLNNNYSVLQSYLSNNSNIEADSSLYILSDFVQNKCDLELEEWQQATEHYESIISNPTSFEDSIFAIIDLGHLYFLMENGSKKSSKAITKYPEYQFEKRKDFVKNRNFLLSLLPENKSTQQQEIYSLETANLVTVVPNPAKSQANFYLNFIEKANIEIKVFDLNGRLVLSEFAIKNSGNQMISIDFSIHPLGVYYYSILVNEQQEYTGKLVLAK